MRNALTAMLGVRFGLTLPNGKGILSPANSEVSPEQTATKGPTYSAYVHGSALASQTELPRTLPRADGLQVPGIIRNARPDRVEHGSTHHALGQKHPRIGAVTRQFVVTGLNRSQRWLADEPPVAPLNSTQSRVLRVVAEGGKVESRRTYLMKRVEPRDLVAGRELDALIAEKVMGWTVFHFSRQHRVEGFDPARTNYLDRRDGLRAAGFPSKEKAEETASSQSTPFLVTATERSTERTTDPHPTHYRMESSRWTK